MFDPKHVLPLRRQAELVEILRSAVYHPPRPISAADLAPQRRIDALHLEYPLAGTLMLRDMLNSEG